MNNTALQIKNMLEEKKILLKGLKNKTGKLYDAYIIPEGVEKYSYTKNGEKKSGMQFKFRMDFPKRNKY